MVGQVLAQRQPSVGFQVGQHVNLREEVGILVSPFCKVLSIAFLPPVVHVSLLVELTSLVVKSVGHLVAYHHADGTVVEGIVGRHVEERNLQNTSREADFVRGRVVVRVHGLRCHVPVVYVDGLSSHVVDVVLVPELQVLNVVLIVRFFRVYGHLCYVNPLVGIAHFHVEGVQLQQGVHFRRVVHPFLRGYTLAQGYLQVLHQLHHALLGSSGEVLLHIDAPQGLTHSPLHLTGSSAPQRMVLLAACHRAAEEVEVGLAHLVVQVAGCTHDDPPFHVVAILGGLNLGQQFVGALHKGGLAYHQFLHVLALQS